MRCRLARSNSSRDRVLCAGGPLWSALTAHAAKYALFVMSPPMVVGKKRGGEPAALGRAHVGEKPTGAGTVLSGAANDQPTNGPTDRHPLIVALCYTLNACERAAAPGSSAADGVAAQHGVAAGGRCRRRPCDRRSTCDRRSPWGRRRACDRRSLWDPAADAIAGPAEPMGSPPMASSQPKDRRNPRRRSRR